MKFVQHNPGQQNLIRRYSADGIVVGERELRASCLVTPDQVIESWAARSVADLDVGNLDTLLKLDPEIVVLATGDRAQFPPAAIRAQFGARKIGLEVMALGPACRTYNVLVVEGRRVVAAILLG
jgi:uncharacterized protein